MSTISGIVFQVPQLPPVSLKRITDSDHDIQAVLSGRTIPNYPPLRLSQILRVIENGNAEAIALVEWLGLFNDDFSLLNAKEEQRACLLLWQAISQLPRVARLALYIAANYMSGAQIKFPDCLISTLDIAKEHLRGINQTRIQWLIALRDKDIKKIIRLAVTARCSPLTFNENIGMPKISGVRESILIGLPDYIIERIKHVDRDLVYLCINQMTRAEKVVFFDAMLLKNDTALETLQSVIESCCLPDSSDTIWSALSPISREVLSKKFELGGYYSLKGLIDTICLPENIAQLQLTAKEVQQMRGRSAFWSNYSGQFNQSRLLIPEKTSYLLNIRSTHQASGVIVMRDSQEDNAEVFVFELANKIIVEVLRGSASEIRFFELNARNQSRLLNDKSITLNKIRKMSCDVVFDHVHLWQYFCEKCLREDFSIFPNENLKKFSGMGSKYNAYSVEQGLPLPSVENITKRLEQLEEWNKAFWTREAKIKGVGNEAQSLKGFHYLQLAKVAANQGSVSRYNEFLKTAAEYGNPESLCILAEKTFKSDRPTFNEWAAAEKLVSQALALGFDNATKLVEKYKLKVIPASEFEAKVLNRKSSAGGATAERELRQLKLPKSLSERIHYRGDRPLVKFKIDELERFSKYAESEAVKSILIKELEKRNQRKRTTDLLASIRSM